MTAHGECDNRWVAHDQSFERVCNGCEADRKASETA